MQFQFQPAVLRTSACAVRRKSSAKSGSPTFLASTIPPTHRATSASARSRARGSFRWSSKDLDQLLRDLLVGGLDRLTAALNIGSRSEQRAAAVAVVEVLAREIGVDDSSREGLRDRTRLAPLLPSCGHPLAQKLPDGRRVELILATEVTIEAAVGEAGTAHDFLNGHPGIAVAVEKPPGAFEDFLARVALVLR